MKGAKHIELKMPIEQLQYAIECLDECRTMWKEMERRKAKQSVDKYTVMYDLGLKSLCGVCEYSYIYPVHCGRTCLLASLWPLGCTGDIYSPYRPFHYDRGIPEDARKIWQECSRLLKILRQRLKRRQKNDQ